MFTPTCRQVLNLMVIFGFMLNYALRVNLTIAIVAMVTTPLNSTDNEPSSNLTAITNPDISTTVLPPVSAPTETSEGKFEWDSYQQNFVLGSFFWGYILTELPGGRLAELIGGHRVFGHSMLWASLLTILTPAAAFIHYNVLIFSRVLLGFMLGASWPAIHPMTAVWIPPMDRSKFISNMMASSLGAAITMPICGFLISWLGWQSVFYVTGGIGLLWSICWFVFIFETPAKHPRISEEERREIEEAIGTTTSKVKPSYVPWASILTAPCVWAIILTHGASVFGYFTVVNQLPTYMKHILKFNIKENGLLSSLPYFGKYFMAVSSSILADYLRQTGKLSTTATRKIFTGFAVATPGLLMIAQAFLGQNAAWSVTIFTLALTVNGAVTAGYLGNGLDIAPNFSGTIFGLANTLSSFGGFLSTWMVGIITYTSNTYAEWRIVFLVLACTYIFGSLAFVFMGSGELQPWNNPPEKNEKANTPDIEKQPDEEIPLKTGNEETEKPSQ